jgi:hypothetical protein
MGPKDEGPRRLATEATRSHELASRVRSSAPRLGGRPGGSRFVRMEGQPPRDARAQGEAPAAHRGRRRTPEGRPPGTGMNLESVEDDLVYASVVSRCSPAAPTSTSGPTILSAGEFDVTEDWPGTWTNVAAVRPKTVARLADPEVRRDLRVMREWGLTPPQWRDLPEDDRDLLLAESALVCPSCGNLRRCAAKRAATGTRSGRVLRHRGSRAGGPQACTRSTAASPGHDRPPPARRGEHLRCPR